MKHLHLRHFVTLLVVGLLAASVFAQPGEGQGPGPREPGQRFEGIKDRLIQAVDATEEQQKQIEQILDTHAQAVKNWQAENKDKIKAAMDKLKEARQADDKEALQAAREELKKVHQGRLELRETLKKQLAEVLSKEQMEKATQTLEPKRRMRGKMDGKDPKGPRGMRGKMDGKGPQGRRGMRGKMKGKCPDGPCDMKGKKDGKGMPRRPGGQWGKGPGMGLGQLDLTDAQKEQIKGIMKDAHEQAKASKDQKAKREIMKTALKKVHDEVFTDAQRTKAKELRRKHHPLAGIATDEQMDKADDIMMAAGEEIVKAKTPKERQAILKAARDKINNEVLTEEQRKKLDEQRKQRREKVRDKFLAGLGLTEEQQAKADKILDDAHKKAMSTDDHIERQMIMLQAHKQIRDEVMTEQQRNKFKEMGKRGLGPKGRRGPKDRPEGPRGPQGGPGGPDRGPQPQDGPPDEDVNED